MATNNEIWQKLGFLEGRQGEILKQQTEIKKELSEKQDAILLKLDALPCVEHAEKISNMKGKVTLISGGAGAVVGASFTFLGRWIATKLGL